MSFLIAENLAFMRNGRMLLDGVSAEFHAGEVVAIVGPNGAGKSTFARLLSGECQPTKGLVRLGGQNIATITPWRLAAMRAVMPQVCEIAFPFSALEIATLGVMGIGRGLNGNVRREIVRRALDEADISHLATRSYLTLSGGEKQRVQFARVLAQLDAGRSLEEQQLLLLDEPIASLDLKHQLQLLHKVRNFAEQGLTVLAVLHDLQLAADIANKILVLAEGRLADFGSPEKVLRPHQIKRTFGIGLTTPYLPPSPWKTLDEVKKEISP